MLNRPPDHGDMVPPPVLQGRRLMLKPLTPEHHRRLYELSLSDDINYRWRYRGSVPDFDVFVRSLSANVLVQFVVTANDSPRVIGHVLAYNPSFQDGHVALAAMVERSIGAGMIEAAILFGGYLFDVWPFRKLYLEVAEFNAPQFASGVKLGLFKEEGRFHGHRYFREKYWDLITFAIYREDAATFAESHSELFHSA